MRAPGDGRPSSFVRIADAASRGAGWLASAALLAMLGMICFDVVMRYVFNEPTVWATEIATYVLVAVALLGCAETHRLDGHIRVELLVTQLDPARRRRLLLAACWAGTLFVAFAAWQATVLTVDNWVNGTRNFSLLYTPIYLPQIPMAAGFVLFLPAMLAEARRLSPDAAGWRDAAVAAVLVATAVALVALGLRPPRLPGIGIDWGSVLIAAAVAAMAWLWSGGRALAEVTALLALAAAAFLLPAKGDVGLVVLAEAAVTLLLLAAGVRVSLALGLVGLVAIYTLLPVATPIVLAERSWESLNSFTLTAVPMFVMMGALLLKSGLSDQVFETLAKWLGRFPGGIAHAGIGACTVFAAVSGSSLATAATMGMVACPEMTRRGFSPRLAYGSIAAGGTLGILIPPSIPMIIYGSMVGAPVATLFVAGLLPGLLLMAAFMAVVFLWGVLVPGAAPRGASVSWGERLRALGPILPVVLLIGAVLGTLYAGIATPTEAGALGAGAALLLCLARGRLTLPVLSAVLAETVKVTAFLFVIVIGASILTYSFDYLRLPQLLVEAVSEAGLPRWLVFAAIALLYIVLGMFIDSISMMVMTLPVLFPLVVATGFDPIWFGVVLVILIEIGLITPPVGVNLFVLKGLGHDVSMRDIVVGVVPFAAVMLVVLVLLYVFPGIATWLPETMAR